ncbi:3-deoxy-7-phosphoheptulonate synthase [Streptomyces sp. WAC06614]|uniref:3-deoxy-7-phosphoheptulonate synthase n=1 Tax=Streptomyces sp. WAC06614 TaxID=2487416 RepID=UPI000F76A0A0|nr:3-deoxy-7-phosphoheptulonate synthase [Streptomyces sp. WAC06614]RSS80764.1 3-deoxy-7-phosphoheptulonate synthase class II [Streptomyces sp. WAC06614]
MIGTAPGALKSAQQPDWPDPAVLATVVDLLAEQPPLTPLAESDALRARLAAAARGEALLLQGGHCAEEFGDRALGEAESTATTLRQMAEVISYGAAVPVVPLGRMAGQYAKPRSKPTEEHDGVELPAYRGDAVNGLAFTAADRAADPWRMMTAYDTAARTLDRIRLLPGSDGDTGGVPGLPLHVSHEALLLDYETPLVRVDEATGRRYAGSGHFVWIGERTRQLDGGHVAFAASIANPVGVKVGPTATADELLALTEILDPDNEPGRLTFITRMGAGTIRDVLPGLVEKVTAAGSPALWVTDPMHGNTRVAAGGRKTRLLDDITAEIRAFVEIHRDLGTHPGGLHLELTGAHVTECVGGTDPVTLDDLDLRYTTACDPRLNRGQALDLAFLAADLWRPAT